MRSRYLPATLLGVAAALPVAAQTHYEVHIPGHDGTPLATDVYLPEAAAPVATVLIRTPYGKARRAALCELAARRGLGCVVQDLRGYCGSGGDNTVFRDDGADGRAAVAWIAEQSWSSGRIGTLGESALGIVQYAMAPDAPPALSCLMPVAATADLYHHAIFQGGVLRWSMIYFWLMNRDALDFYEELLEHRLLDDWHEPYLMLRQPDRVRSPILHVGAWYDIYTQGTLDAFTTLRRHGGAGAAGSQYLIMGPWSHSTFGETTIGELELPEPAELDLLAITADWVSGCLEGEHDAVADWPRARVYLMGAVGEPEAPGNRWLRLDNWPPPATTVPFHLEQGGSLTTAEPPVGELELIIDPRDPVPTLGGANLFPFLEVKGRPMGDGPYDQRPVEARDDVLSFTSEPLERPLDVIGRVTARIWVLSDTVDLDLSVRLSDVYPDGRSMLILDGIQRARMRCGDGVECPLEPGVPVEIEVDLWSTAIAVNAGHRVRVSVAGSNWPRFELNPHLDGVVEGRAATVARPLLLFGPEHPSALLLPVVELPIDRDDGQSTIAVD